MKSPVSFTLLLLLFAFAYTSELRSIKKAVQKQVQRIKPKQSAPKHTPVSTKSSAGKNSSSGKADIKDEYRVSESRYHKAIKVEEFSTDSTDESAWTSGEAY